MKEPKTKGETMGRNLAVVALALVAALSIGGCQQQKADEGPDYADDEAMAVVADGLEARSDTIDKQVEEGVDTTTNAAYEEAVQTELEVVEPLRDRQFKNSEMQEDVLSYINLLNDSLDVLENYPTSDVNFYTKWTEVYDDRTSMLNKFVEEYGLTVEAKYQDVLDELVTNGAAATKRSEMDEKMEALASSIVFEKTDQGYGYFEYTATVENTTGMNLKDVSLVLSLYDAEGVKAGETYASTNSWDAGEKVRFEAGSDIDAVTVKVAIDYYDTESND
jgi:hypothetical protein